MKQYSIVIMTILVIIVDQLSKWLVINSNHGHIINDGVALSIFRGNYYLGLVLNFIGLLIIGYLLSKELNNKLISLLSFSLILGGGLSNLIDRIFRSGVIDFISFKDIPVFNIADSFIIFGVFLILIQFLLKLDVFKKIHSK